MASVFLISFFSPLNALVHSALFGKVGSVIIGIVAAVMQNGGLPAAMVSFNYQQLYFSDIRKFRINGR